MYKSLSSPSFSVKKLVYVKSLCDPRTEGGWHFFRDFTVVGVTWVNTAAVVGDCELIPIYQFVYWLLGVLTFCICLIMPL